MTFNHGACIQCDGPGCKASSDDYEDTRGTRMGNLQRARKALMEKHQWVCGLGLDLCPKCHDARYALNTKQSPGR